MKLNEKDLLDLKEKIEKAKSKVSELTGQETAELRRIKEEFNCLSVEDAKIELVSIEKSISIINKKIEKGTEELEKQLNETEEEE